MRVIEMKESEQKDNFGKERREHRVVVTGIGVVSPIGIGVDAFWESLLRGRNGIGRVTHFDPSEYRSQMAAEVKDFRPENWIEEKTISRLDRFTLFALASAALAVRDAGLDGCAFNPDRAGVICGSGIGGAEAIEEGYALLRDKGPKSLGPFIVSKSLINTAACMVSIKHGLKGPLSAPSVACSTGTNAIGDAFRILQRGDADIMLAGGSEASVSPLPYAGFCGTRSMSTRNDCVEKASRPFDKNRDGFVMGEGSAIVVLETLEHARKRRARILAELAGYGNTADAFHFTAPEPGGDGMMRVMKAALLDADLEPAAIGYINAHGTSTAMNDKNRKRGYPEGLRRPRAVLKNQFHQVDDRAPPGGGRSRGIRRHCNERSRGPDSADDQFRGARPGVSPGLCDRRRGNPVSRGGHEQFVRLRRGQRLPGRKKVWRLK